MIENKAEAVKLENLTTGYRNRHSESIVSEKINLSAEKGKLIFLTGQNGAGKTTLLKTITGDLKPLSGKVSVGGDEISSLKRKELSRLISVVLTSIPDPGYMTVDEIVTLGRAPYTGFKNSLSDNDNSIIEKSIEMLSLSHVRKRLFSKLSDGEKQKTMIARALCQDTEIICMDEPSSHLDFPSRIELISFLKTISENEKKTVIVSSHDLNSAVSSSDIMWLINKTGKVHSGAPEDLALEGIIGKVFNRGNFSFSEERGEFIIEKSFTNSLTLEGDKLPVLWTARGLRKIGIETRQCEGKPDISIVKKKDYEWNYRNMVFPSIGSLLDYIKYHHQQ